MPGGRQRRENHTWRLCRRDDFMPGGWEEEMISCLEVAEEEMDLYLEIGKR